MPGYQYNPGGITVAGLTSNVIPKATGSSSLGPSLLTDDATNVTLSSGKLIIPAGSAPGIGSSSSNTTGLGISGTTSTFYTNGSVSLTIQSGLLYLTLMGLKLPGVTKTTNFTMTQADAFVYGDATGGAITLTLPAASNATNGTIGQFFVIQKIDASVNAVNISRAGADTINGAVSKSLATQYAGILIFGTGATSWGAFALTAA